MLVDGAHPAKWRDPAAQDLADIGWRILWRPIIHERRLSTLMSHFRPRRRTVGSAGSGHSEMPSSR
jgi:hypothetical protein